MVEYLREYFHDWMEVDYVIRILSLEDRFCGVLDDIFDAFLHFAGCLLSF